MTRRFRRCGHGSGALTQDQASDDQFRTAPLALFQGPSQSKNPGRHGG